MKLITRRLKGQLKKHSPGATSVNKRDGSHHALTIHLPTRLGFRLKQLSLVEKLLSVPISHQGRQEQMGLQSDTKGMEDPGDHWGTEGILVEKMSSENQESTSFSEGSNS